MKQPDFERPDLSSLSGMGRLYAESLRTNSPGVWKQLEESGELAERLARNDKEIQQSYQTILAHNAKNHGLDPNDPLYADRLKVLAGMAREQVLDCWLIKDAETMEADLDGYLDPPEDAEDEEADDDEADLTLDRVEGGSKDVPRGPKATPDADSSGNGVMVAGMPLDEYLKRADRMMSDHPEPSERPFPKRGTSEKQ